MCLLTPQAYPRSDVTSEFLSPTQSQAQVCHDLLAQFMGSFKNETQEMVHEAQLPLMATSGMSFLCSLVENKCFLSGKN